MKYTFTAEIQKADRGAFVLFPYDLLECFGSKKQASHLQKIIDQYVKSIFYHTVLSEPAHSSTMSRTLRLV